MPANIDSMMWVAQKPWHGLGRKLDHPATAEEAIQAAGLDWTVSKVPLFTEDGKRAPIMMTSRDDTKSLLGVVGPQYRIVQNKEAFTFFDAVVGEKAAMYDTAGAIGNGEVIWMLAKLPDPTILKRVDVIDHYLLLATSHDRSLSLTMKFTPIRVVCQNTLILSLGDQQHRVQLKHTPNILWQVARTRDILGLASVTQQLFAQAAERLSSLPLNTERWKTYVSEVMGWNETKRQSAYQQTYQNNLRITLTNLFETGQGSDFESARGTLWGGYNAICEYADYYRKTGSKDSGTSNDSLDPRLVVFGDRARLKQRAWDQALVMAGS